MHDARPHTVADPQSAPPQTQSDAIVANALAAQVAAPSRTGSGDGVRLLAYGVLALLALGIGAVVTGAIHLTSPGGGPTDIVGGRDRDNTYSYYHDQQYETQDTGPKWTTDRTRSTDPDEAVLGDSTRWEYDGTYKYGPYGSDGMRKRARGTTSADPLYSQPAALPDVFTADGDLDPSGGAPVGAPPSNYTNPYYDPYAGYTNPYANRIRLAYGEGYGAGASSTIDPSGTPLG